MSNNLTLKAIAYKTGMTDSSWVASATYTIQVATPTFTVRRQEHMVPAQSVILSSTTAGASIRYTTDGSTPSLPRSVRGFTSNTAIAVSNNLYAESHRLQDRHDGQPGGFSRLHHHRRRRNALVQPLLDQSQGASPSITPRCRGRRT